MPNKGITVSVTPSGTFLRTTGLAFYQITFEKNSIKYKLSHPKMYTPPGSVLFGSKLTHLNR